MTNELTRIPAFMAFWDAINEGRANKGLPEALFFNVRTMWEAAMVPTQTEVDCAKVRAPVVEHGPELTEEEVIKIKWDANAERRHAEYAKRFR